MCFIQDTNFIKQYININMESGKMKMKVVEKARIKTVCVFCGSSPGKRLCYQDAAVELGKELVARKMDLVYRGGSIGFMGSVSQAVHSAGGHVIGLGAIMEDKVMVFSGGISDLEIAIITKQSPEGTTFTFPLSHPATPCVNAIIC